MLHLVNVNGFDTVSAQRGIEKKELVALGVKGVYCDAADEVDLPNFMRRHAVRIANYLYDKSSLAYASAHYKGAVASALSTPDKPHYRLFLLSSYTRALKLPHLEIVQVDTLKNKQVYEGTVKFSEKDEHGQLHDLDLRCATDELVYLQNFGRRRYYPERFLSDDAARELRRALELKHGTDDQGRSLLPTRLRALAESCEDYGEELDRALEHLRTTPLDAPDKEPAVANIYDFTVAWFRRPVAKITFNGTKWSFNYDDGWLLPLSAEKVVHGEIPQFIPNLFSEGYAREQLFGRLGSASSMATILSNSERYLSHIAIVEDPLRLGKLPDDVLARRLADTSDGDRVFTGTVAGMPHLNQNFPTELNDLICRRAVPRISGTQAKIPSYLDAEGRLWPAGDRPFTHILKLPGLSNDRQCARGGVEWASMSMARAAGLKTADFALVDLQPEIPGQQGLLSYVTERFDVPTSEDDARLFFAEDVCSAAGLNPAVKMGIKRTKANGQDEDAGTAEYVADLVAEHSTKPAEDAQDLFRQIFASYLLENGDLHLKNFAFLKSIKQIDLYRAGSAPKFGSVRLAPAYDVMCTAPFSPYGSRLEMRSETMVLSVNGALLRQPERADFVALAKYMKLDPAAAEQAMDDMAIAVHAFARDVGNNLPAVFAAYPGVADVVTHVFERATYRCHEWLPELAQGLLEEQELPVESKRRRFAP